MTGTTPRHLLTGEAMTRPEREGKKQVSAFVSVEQWKTLRHIVTDTQRTANELIDEAITLLAEKYREQPQQPTGKKISRRDRSPTS
jgi:hypothetical protein